MPVPSATSPPITMSTTPASAIRAGSTTRTRVRRMPEVSRRTASRGFGFNERMAGFHPFDSRGYRTVDARSGYGEWAPTYEQTVEDAMDIDLLEALEAIRWADVRGAADLGCGSGRSGATLAGRRVAAGARRGGGGRARPHARDARGRAGARCAPATRRGRRRRQRPAGRRLRPRRELSRRRAPRRRRRALPGGVAARAARRAARPRRLPSALHHGLGHADPLRLRLGRARRDRDPRPPAQRTRVGRPGGGLDARGEARARHRRRVADAQAEVGVAARAPRDVRVRVAQGHPRRRRLTVTRPRARAPARGSPSRPPA